MVLVGAGPWLHVPVGKLHEDRYLPLHPQLVTLIDAYRAAHVPADHPLLLPRERPPARPPYRHPDDQPGRRRRPEDGPGCAASTTACWPAATSRPASNSARALAAQHDHAAASGQTSRQELFARLINQLDDNQAS